MRVFTLVVLSCALVTSGVAQTEYPRVETAKSAWPDEIFLVGTGVPDEAEVTLTVEGVGEAIPAGEIDLIFAIDVSGSMEGGPLDDAKALAIYIVNHLAQEFGQSGLVTFDEHAVLLRQLSYAHLKLLPMIKNLVAFGNTAMGDAINVAQTELTSPRHMEKHLPVILIISDGSSNRGANPIAAAQNAKASGTVIRAVGMGTPVEEGILRQVVSEPDTENYWHYPDSTMYEQIYIDLHLLPSILAARHLSVVELPDPRFNYVPGSFSISPDSTLGRSTMWNIGEMDIGDSWTVSFRVTGSDTGLLPLDVLPTSRATYMNFAGGWEAVPFPQAYVHVIMGVGVEEGPEPIRIGQGRFSISPNPFSESVTVSYFADGFTDVNITIHDLAGRLISTLFSGTPAAGSHKAVWDGSGVYGDRAPDGSYILSFRSGDVVESKVVLLVR